MMNIDIYFCLMYEVVRYSGIIIRNTLRLGARIYHLKYLQYIYDRY